MIKAEMKRTDVVQKVCPYCGHEFLGSRDDGELFCEEHRGAEL